MMDPETIRLGMKSVQEDTRINFATKFEEGTSMCPFVKRIVT